MHKLIDLTGQKFGRLTVIKRGENSKSGQTKWYCKCDCGNPDLALIYASNLKKGFTKSCGCLNKEKAKEHARQMGLSTRKHFGCMICGSDKHYAKGLCHACYERTRVQKIKYQNKKKGA